MLTHQTFTLLQEEQDLTDEIARLRARIAPLLDVERRAIAVRVELAQLEETVAKDGPYRADARVRTLQQELQAMWPAREELRGARRRETALMLRVEAMRRRLEASGSPRRQASTPRTLPLLRSVQIAAPCPVPWDDMEGDGAVRRCKLCAKDVHDLSAMTADEAERVLVVSGGTACVRLYRRPDGTVMTSDCAKGVEQVRERRNERIFLVAAAAAVAAGAALANAVKDPPPLPHSESAYNGFVMFVPDEPPDTRGT